MKEHVFSFKYADGKKWSCLVHFACLKMASFGALCTGSGAAHALIKALKMCDLKSAGNVVHRDPRTIVASYHRPHLVSRRAEAICP